MTKSYQPSFPTGDHSCVEPQNGLSKREHFASMAMQGLLASVMLSSLPIKIRMQMAVEAADYLIEQLNIEK